MRFFILSIVSAAATFFSASLNAQTLELGMPRDSVMRLMRQAHIREGDAHKSWDLEFQPVVFADLSGIYTVRFDASNRLESIQFNQHVGDLLSSTTWIRVVSEFKTQRLDEFREEHTVSSDTYSWKKNGNHYSLTNKLGFLTYSAATPSAGKHARPTRH